MPAPTTARAEYPHAIAFAIQVARNRLVQGLGVLMVTLVGLTVAPWFVVLGWMTATVAVIVIENRVLQRVTREGAASSAARIGAPVMRVLMTSLYAVAALTLMLRGGPRENLFAFALMSASAVHVLMRYYRSRKILLLSLSPYLVVLCVGGLAGPHANLASDGIVAALTPLLTAAMFAVQFWSARAQLSGAWTELSAAREAAEERERAAQAANLTKSQFLTTMSHELRTPLHGVLGMAQALRKDALTPAQSDRVGIIVQQGESLLGMLNDLLDLSRVEAGALVLEPVEFDLEHLVRGVAAAYEPLAHKKGLRFDLTIAPATRGLYRGDASRIRRLLYSLSDNAVKFTKTGAAGLSVDRVGETLVFIVTDTGIGIAPQMRERLFEGFFQADSSLARAYDGAGIGLAICARLTALMGGTIDVRSTPGQGSTFTVSLPLPQIEAAAPPSARAAEAGPTGHGRLRQLRVLAAEDNLVNQMVLRTFLEPTGIDPIMVENGRQALEAWESDTWDIVLMDIQMPEMNGVEATRVIRSREQETGRPRTPILAVTASAMTHQLEEFAAAGMDGVVPKPVNLASLLRMIEQALPDSRAA